MPTARPGIGADLAGTTVSGISFPSDLRSWTEPEQLAILPDGNGQIKRGTWPLDLFIPVRDRNGGTSGTIEYGYTGYKSVGKHRIGGIAVNRDTNDFSIGFNIQSRFWDAPANKEQPDFEPAVISYAASGALKWWSRLYHEVMDSNANGQVNSGETRLSSPDQYVDGLAVDYSSMPNRLVVVARCHGNNQANLWNGNTIAASPGAQSFHNQFTGTEGNIHLSWIGKLRDSDGILTNSSYLAGYFRDVSLSQAIYGDPNLDGWPSHNAGWPNLTTTRAEPGSPRTDAAGRVYVVGLGPRMVTTSGAWQKLPKITPSINQGISPWAQFARVMEPNLNTLTYSTAITGEWTYPAAGCSAARCGQHRPLWHFPGERRPDRRRASAQHGKPRTHRQRAYLGHGAAIRRLRAFREAALHRWRQRAIHPAGHHPGTGSKSSRRQRHHHPVDHTRSRSRRSRKRAHLHMVGAQRTCRRWRVVFAQRNQRRQTKHRHLHPRGRLYLERHRHRSLRQIGLCPDHRHRFRHRHRVECHAIRAPRWMRLRRSLSKEVCSTSFASPSPVSRRHGR